MSRHSLKKRQGKSRFNDDVKVLTGLLLIILTMGVLVAFSVPLYRMFCNATGYGGTTRRVEAPLPPAPADATTDLILPGPAPALVPLPPDTQKATVAAAALSAPAPVPMPATAPAPPVVAPAPVSAPATLPPAAAPAPAAPAAPAAKMVTVSFDGNVDSALPWEFGPDQRNIKVKLGETVTVNFHAVNKSDKTLTGTATFNVQPDKAGPYFDKIQCFCFTRQTLKAGQAMELPVQFYVDPEMAKDINAKDVENITLSYTFFLAKTPHNAAKKPVPAAKYDNAAPDEFIEP